MLGLAVLLAIGIYLAISALVVWFAVRWARKHNRKPWVWGGLAAFAMYNLVFWDLIPTLIMHKYYCATGAGFWVYKTPEQWMKENPGVRDTLRESLKPKSQELTNGWYRYWKNQRFYQEVRQSKNYAHAIGYAEQQFFDAKTGGLLARSIDYWRGQSGNVFGLGGTPDELRQALILGWGNRFCGTQGQSPSEMFDQFTHIFWEWGQSK